MDQETLRKVQLVLLDMAKEIKRVCTVLGIKYHLDSGTLLGAVRHKGFIPWDDDLDIGMTREDYEVFIKKAPALLREDYYLQTWHNDPKYGLPFAKLRKKGTVYVEEASANTGARTGFYVDIFPYNSYPNDIIEQKKQGRKCDLYRRLVLIKCNYSPWKASDSRVVLKKYVYYIAKFLVLSVSKEELINRYQKACTKYEGIATEYVFPSGTTNYGKWVIKRNCIEDLAPLEFEGDEFLCPNDYDQYLRAAYGEYMILPPEDKRVNRHHIISIDFGQNQMKN